MLQKSKTQFLTKETQTQGDNHNLGSSQKQNDEILRHHNDLLNSDMQNLRIDLKVKEDLIESINDSVVLKEAEIARLKTRIGLLERKISQQNFKESC